MVAFQELRITPDGQKLIIDVSVKDLEYYTNVYLDTIQIDTQDIPLLSLVQVVRLHIQRLLEEIQNQSNWN